ncbi:MAG: hypothetical protein KIT72_09875 [Polyangiaceae bacterium]|nr:hypothetical protein [Polyangiaceae bacterium]MCW5790717.1 hypothetical protein [Polyangiaceae bacterium]
MTIQRAPLRAAPRAAGSLHAVSPGWSAVRSAWSAARSTWSAADALRALGARLPLVAITAYAATQLACQDAPVSLPLRSLERSGEVAFVCVNRAGGAPEGRSIDDCPDFDETDDGGELNQLLALVTQTARGEVAVVNLSSGRVEDIDPGSPGFNFLPVGAQPTGIAATPGGHATFVGAGELGREAIFALPSSCITRPQAGDAPRDLTTWSACALPVPPAELRVLLDAPAADGSVRESCSGAATEPGAQLGRACPADLSEEPGPPGRRKLLVSLPDWGELWLLDAQRILDAEPGSFDYCEPEVVVKLSGATPAAPPAQEVPAELGEAPEPVAYEQTDWAPYPAGITESRGTLYVADRGAPLVHRIDVRDVCAPQEIEPLFPVRLDRPGTTVLTSQLAVSPITRSGERFLYATDELEGSVMAFDVSEGASNLTPLVRPRSERTPFEPADRIRFDAPVRALTFVQRDIPVLDGNGVGIGGRLCDPITDSLGAEYRPNGQLTAGARPGQLRGIFGMLALTSGQIAVIDVEDYDAPCRRPVAANANATPDFRGCAGDPSQVAFFTEDGRADGTPTVSGEASCHVVTPHRARSAVMVSTSTRSGIRSPGLRSLPRLSRDGAALPVGFEGDAANHPKLLATSFADGKAPELFVAGRLFSTGAEPLLPTSPSSATTNSLALITDEVRAFPLEEELRLTYEGAIVERPAGYLSADARKLEDTSGAYCRRGVHDQALARLAGEELGLEGEALDTFARSHGDYVAITEPLLDEDDAYWDLARREGLGCSYDACRAGFGTPETPTTARDFTIVEASERELVVTPRETPRAAEVMKCCFPSATKYSVRAGRHWVLTGSRSGFRHQVMPDPDTGRCVPDPSGAKAHHRSRAYEVSCAGSACGGIGQATRFDEQGRRVPDTDAVACLTSSSNPPRECVFQNLTHRFVVYRGALPSERDMRFTWQVAGGFTPLSISLAAESSAVSPLSMQLLPQTGELAVTDAATQGLLMVNLRSLAVSRVFY